MRKKKIIKADPNRFNRLVEYSYLNTENEDKELIFGSENILDEEEDEPSFEDLGIDQDEFSANMDDTKEEDALDADKTTEETPDEVEVSDGEVELDVTDIVNSSKEATDLTAQAISKLDQLMSHFSELEDRLSNMEVITDKIDQLEKEVEKRNPTPVEKMEIRSLNSFPYNIRLTDFWKEKEGYDVTADEDEEIEYKIDSEEIDKTYNAGSIKSSFGEPDAM